MPNFNVYSYLVYSFLNKQLLSLQCCKSRAGWYIGVNGYSRDSVEYYKSYYECNAALSACSWTQRLNP